MKTGMKTGMEAGTRKADGSVIFYRRVNAMDHLLADYLKAGAAEFGAEIDENMVRHFFVYKTAA